MIINPYVLLLGEQNRRKTTGLHDAPGKETYGHFILKIVLSQPFFIMLTAA